MNIDDLANGLRHSIGSKKNNTGTGPDKVCLPERLNPFYAVTALAQMKIENQQFKVLLTQNISKFTTGTETRYFQISHSDQVAANGGPGRRIILNDSDSDFLHHSFTTICQCYLA